MLYSWSVDVLRLAEPVNLTEKTERKGQCEFMVTQNNYWSMCSSHFKGHLLVCTSVWHCIVTCVVINANKNAEGRLRCCKGEAYMCINKGTLNTLMGLLGSRLKTSVKCLKALVFCDLLLLLFFVVAAILDDQSSCGRGERLALALARENINGEMLGSPRGRVEVDVYELQRDSQYETTETSTSSHNRTLY